jgi:hypothetical protein
MAIPIVQMRNWPHEATCQSHYYEERELSYFPDLSDFKAAAFCQKNKSPNQTTIEQQLFIFI